MRLYQDCGLFSIEQRMQQARALFRMATPASSSLCAPSSGPAPSSSTPLPPSSACSVGGRAWLPCLLLLLHPCW